MKLRTIVQNVHRVRTSAAARYHTLLALSNRMAEEAASLLRNCEDIAMAPDSDNYIRSTMAEEHDQAPEK